MSGSTSGFDNGAPVDGLTASENLPVATAVLSTWFGYLTSSPGAINAQSPASTANAAPTAIRTFDLVRMGTPFAKVA